MLSKMDLQKEAYISLSWVPVRSSSTPIVLEFFLNSSIILPGIILSGTCAKRICLQFEIRYKRWAEQGVLLVGRTSWPWRKNQSARAIFCQYFRLCKRGSNVPFSFAW